MTHKMSVYRHLTLRVINDPGSSSQKLQLSYWDSLIKEYFTPKASLKFTLWKDNQRNEAKPFGQFAAFRYNSNSLNRAALELR